MDEFNQEQSTITHEKLEELRTLCNELCDKTISLVEGAIVETNMEKKKLKEITKDKVDEIIVNNRFIIGIKYVTTMLLKNLGISFLNINPSLIKVNTFSEFKENEAKNFLDSHAGKMLMQMEKMHLEAADILLDYFNRVLDSVKNLKSTLNRDYRQTLLCYRGLLKAYSQPKNPREDMVMLHYAMTECGISPKYTIREILEERSTNELQVRQFIERNLLKYEKDQKFKEEEKDVTMRM